MNEPLLPEPCIWTDGTSLYSLEQVQANKRLLRDAEGLFDAGQMKEYAAAVRADLAEQPEPVAWMVEDADKRHFIFRMGVKPTVSEGEALTPLYTHPPRKPVRLTDEQFDAACSEVPAAVYELMYGHEINVQQFRAAMRTVARAVEAAVLRKMGVSDE